MKITQKLFILLIINLFSTSINAAEKVHIVAPQNYISDFPNERLSIQGLNVNMIYDDIVIPGNGGMDIIVTRRQYGDKINFNAIYIGTGLTYASDKTVFSSPCLGDYQTLNLVVNGIRQMGVGYDSLSDIPDSTIAIFENHYVLQCKGNTPIVKLPNGRKLLLTKIKTVASDYTYGHLWAVSRMEDRFGNYIDYEYEHNAFTESYNRKKLLKKITRNDGQVVNFIYAESFRVIKPTEIHYSGKKVQYKYSTGRLDTFIDAEGRKTEYTYALNSGIGYQIQTITTPENLKIEYRYKVTGEGMIQLPNYIDEVQRIIYDDQGEGSGELFWKIISGPSLEDRKFYYDTTFGAQNYVKTLIYQDDIRPGVDLTTEYLIKSLRNNRKSGQLKSIKKYEGEFVPGGISRPQEYLTHELRYEQTFTWEAISSSEIGCATATRYIISAYSMYGCAKYEVSDEVLKVKNGNVFDIYTTDIKSFNKYGQPITTTESFGSNSKTTVQSYDHDVSNWIINQPSITKVGSSLSNFTDVREITYYAKSDVNYPFFPYEEKSFGVWQKKYSEYYIDGSIKKVEYNQKLAHGDTSVNRYQIFSNYKRGIAQTFTYPKRYTTETMNATQVVDNNGWITQKTDFNGNVVNKGYDNIGRLKYIDFVDANRVDTMYNWSYDGGINSDQAKSVLSRCILNAEKIACSDTAKLTVTTTYDGKLRPVEIVTTDIAKQKSIYQNFTYNHFDRKTFASFPSNYAGETLGITYDYDAIQRLTSEVVSNGGSQTTSYLSGNRVKTNNFEGYETTTTYLAYSEPSYGKATSIISPEGVTTSLSVNVFGEVESITQSGSHKSTTISQTQTNLYNTAHQLCMVKRKDVGNTYYQYNYVGELIWQAQGVSGSTCAEHGAATAQKVTFGYDNLGSNHTITYGDSSPNVTYILDKNGDVTNLNSGGVSQAYGYNSARLLEWETLAIDSKYFSLDYEYDTLGNLSALTYPDASVGKVSFAPNAFGQATKATRSANSITTNYATSASYYANGIINTFTYGNGLTHKTTLNIRNFPSEIRDYKDSSNRMKLSYTYDYQNNIKAVIDGIDTNYSLTDLSYDGLDRLTSTTGGGIGSSAIAYDAIGNITSYSNSSIQKSSALTYTYNLTSNKLTDVSGTGSANYNFGQANSYDNRGNITNNGMRSFTYNLANQLTLSDSNSYVYDGYNRRVKTTDSKGISYSMYSQSGRLLYREVEGDPVNYIFLGDKLIAKDGVISTPFDSNMHYKPFGDSIEQTKDDIGYTGHKFDTDLGLSYMQARYYDPVIGRFYSNDPKGFSNVHNFNRYAYANNNPYKYVDPDGKESVSFALTLNVPAITELLPTNIDTSIQGFQLSLNFSFPGASGNGNYGAGFSIDGVLGNELGTEQNSKPTIKSVLKSLAKTSTTGSASFNWTKNGVTDVQNGVSDPEVGGHALVAGGAVSLDGSDNVTGVKVSVGPGLNVGGTVTLPLAGAAFEQGKGVELTGEAFK